MRFSNKDSYLCFVFVIVLCRIIETLVGISQLADS